MTANPAPIIPAASFAGRVVGGKVVFDDSPSLPDGTPVRVSFSASPTESEPVPAIPPLAERLKNVIGKAVGLPSDAALNHNQYLREQHST